MGMVLCLKAAPDSTLKTLLANPESIEEFLYPEEEGDESPTETETDLDKAWHGIHFLLAGQPWEGEEPYNYLVNGGEEIGDVDVGYGTARAVSAEKTAMFDVVLSGIDEANFRARFDPKAMMKADIYPTIWDRDPKVDDTLGYLVEYFNILKEFVKKARTKQHGLIIWIS